MWVSVSAAVFPKAVQGWSSRCVAQRLKGHRGQFSRGADQGMLSPGRKGGADLSGILGEARFSSEKPSDLPPRTGDQVGMGAQ